MKYDDENKSKIYISDKLGKDKIVKIAVTNKKVNPHVMSKIYSDNSRSTPIIEISKKQLKIPGSDLMINHELSHANDDLNKEYNPNENDTPYKHNIERKKIIDRYRKNGDIITDDEHDNLDKEIVADKFAIDNTYGVNNSNRIRKNLNETDRRKLQRTIALSTKDIPYEIVNNKKSKKYLKKYIIDKSQEYKDRNMKRKLTQDNIRDKNDIK